MRFPTCFLCTILCCVMIATGCHRKCASDSHLDARASAAASLALATLTPSEPTEDVATEAQLTMCTQDDTGFTLCAVPMMGLAPAPSPPIIETSAPAIETQAAVAQTTPAPKPKESTPAPAPAPVAPLPTRTVIAKPSIVRTNTPPACPNGQCRVPTRR